MGQGVWADVLRTKGGDDWQRELENALRQQDPTEIVAEQHLHDDGPSDAGSAAGVRTPRP